MGETLQVGSLFFYQFLFRWRFPLPTITEEVVCYVIFVIFKLKPRLFHGQIYSNQFV